MKCPNCLDAESSGSDEVEEEPPAGPSGSSATTVTQPQRKITPRCKHGPNGMCSLCLPLNTPAPNTLSGSTGTGGAAGTAETPTIRCRNHGPHGSCIDCVIAREGRKHKIVSQKAPHIPAISMDRRAAQAFLSIVQISGFSQHRVGILYGQVLPQGTKVDVIYEPPQESFLGGAKLLPDPRAQLVDKLADMLGLEKVGIVFSHPRTKKAEIPLTGRELQMCTDVMRTIDNNKVRKGFVVVTLVRDDKTQNPMFEPFQLSDLLFQLAVENVIAPAQNTDSKLMTTHPVIVEGSETQAADVHFFLMSIAIQEHQGPFRADFPIENRHIPQFDRDLANYLLERKHMPYPQRLSDFHCLLFLTKFLDIKSDFAPLCQAIIDRDDATFDGFSVIFEHIIENARRS